MKRMREVEVDEVTGQRRYRRLELPTIVCLCGSMRFYKWYLQINTRETLEGKIVLTGPAYSEASLKDISSEQKEMLNELQLKKIDLADEIFVINVHGHIGDDTMAAIAYAIWRGKKIRWLEQPLGGTDVWIFNNQRTLGRLVAWFSGVKPIEEGKTITLDEDIEGLGKAGDSVPMSKVLDWGATEGFKLGYHKTGTESEGSEDG